MSFFCLPITIRAYNMESAPVSKEGDEKRMKAKGKATMDTKVERLFLLHIPYVTRNAMTLANPEYGDMRNEVIVLPSIASPPLLVPKNG